MASSKTISNATRKAVLDAMDTCDRMGTDAFLAAHGYRRGLYQVRHGGRNYPSKAILGVACGLGASSFFGGAAHTVRVLRQLGFDIRKGRTLTCDHTSTTWQRVRDAFAVANVTGGAPEQARYTFPNGQEPATVFASGSNRAGEIRGLGMVGHDVGVAVDQLKRPAIDALKALDGTDVQVFVDSGAFTAFSKGTTITPEQWRERLSVYRELALALGSQLWVVAPDVIADQDATLNLLSRYREAIRHLAACGARVLVPVQKGDVDQATFWRWVMDTTVLGDIPGAILPALPCRAAATTPAEVEAFVRDAGYLGHVHLLGLGPNNRKLPAYVNALGGTSYGLDSCWVRGASGWNKPRKGSNGGHPFRYTSAKALAGAWMTATGTMLTGAAYTAAKTELALALCFGL